MRITAGNAVMAYQVAKGVAVLIMLLVLAACAAPKTVEVVRTVQVPVPVPCKIEAPEKPAWEFDEVPADTGLMDQVRALLIEREQREQYERKLEAAVKACQ